MLALGLILASLAPADIDTVESGAFSRERQQAAIAATVQITNVTVSGLGSGTVVGHDDAFVYILTANHVVAKAKELEIRTYSAASYPKPAAVYRAALVVAQLPTEDLALVRLSTRERMPGKLPICPAARVPQAKDFPVLTVGCGDGKAPTCIVDRIVAKKLVRRPGNEDSAWFWELSREPALGRSGGPVLDRRGYLIGVQSGRNDGKGYACHIDEIERLLKRSRLTWLAEPEAKKK